MATKIVIDHDILGWGDEHAKELRKTYESILPVGKHEDLPQRTVDDKVAAYCHRNGCDLLTADAKAYTHYFEAGIGSVKVSRYAWWAKGDRPIYLIGILE